MPFGGHARNMHFNYSGRSSPRRGFSYMPQFWGQGRPAQAVVVNPRRHARAEENKSDVAMRTAVYVGAGALGVIGVGALIYLIAKKD